MKDKKYKYINFNGIICRYPYLPTEKKYSVIGDIYNQKEGTWHSSTLTMKYEMSGFGDVISQNEILSLLKDKSPVAV